MMFYDFVCNWVRSFDYSLCLYVNKLLLTREKNMEFVPVMKGPCSAQKFCVMAHTLGFIVVVLVNLVN